MIVVKVELWPEGDEYRKSEIARVNIANQGPGAADGGKVRYQATYQSVEPLGKLGSGTTEFKHERRLGVLELLRTALNIWAK